jgi:hypothetical protein
MFVDVILVHVVEMAIVQIVDVAVMANRGVPAIRAMLMRVVGVVFLRASGHRHCSSLVLNLVLCAPFKAHMVATTGDAKVRALKSPMA